MVPFLYKQVIIGELRLVSTHFEKIPKNNRYGYARISYKEQAQNSSLDAQKAELIKLGVPEKNIYFNYFNYFKIGSANDAIQNRPIFFKLINEILKEGDLLFKLKINIINSSLFFYF